MNRSRTLTIVAAVALVGMLAVPMTAAAATDLAVGVEQDPETGEAVVTVTDNETAVENATVTVTSEAGYAGNGTYQTGANGSVVLPAPNETVSVTVNASSDNGTTSQQTELVPRADSLDVTASQSPSGATTVTVSQYDEPVENASVEVGADDAIAGNYTTDANGTVTLDQPADDVNATVVATAGNLSAETTIALTGAALDVTVDQRDTGVVVTVTDGGVPAENATVRVESDGDYAGTGTYATDADGEVTLPLPAETVTVEVAATADNETARTTAELTVDIATETPFGLVVSNFVNALQSATVDGPPGQVISEFVTSNNPGSADDAPGRSGDTPGNAGEVPGQSGDTPGNADDAPGRSGDAPGRSGDAPGRSGGDDADDDGNESADAEDTPGVGNGNAPDDAGPDGDDEENDESDDTEADDEENDESDEENEEDDDTEADEADADDEEGGSDDSDDTAESESESDSEDSDATEDSDDSNGDGNSGGNGGAPGNSGNAPGRN